MNRTEHANGLRKLADLIESTDIPYREYTTEYQVFNSIIDEENRMKPGTIARVLKNFSGKVEKSYSESFLTLTADLGGGVEFRASYNRNDVCKRVQVGTEVKTFTEATGYEEVSREVPVYEYECEPLLD